MITSVTVLGAGSYGTALAIALSRNGEKTILWGRNAQDMEVMSAERENHKFLPAVNFPETLEIETSLQKAVQASRDLLIVVPSHAFSALLDEIKPFITDQHRICWASKGLEPKTGRLLQSVWEEKFGLNFSIAMLSGPTFALELAKGVPTAIALASNDSTFGLELQARIHCDKSFRVYLNDDLIGIQLGGAVKNVIAIATGLADGMGLGANARTALITRGLAEMTRLGLALNAQAETLTGLSGLGDLILTCTDNQSRNRRFGLALGQGENVEEAMNKIGQVVEGYRNAEEVHILAKRYDVEMPITEQVYKVLYEGRAYKEAAQSLLSRKSKNE